MDNQPAPTGSDSGEIQLANWSIAKSQSSSPAIIIFLSITTVFVISFLYIFVISKSTNLFSIIIPILLFLALISALSELIKSLKAITESSDVYITERGVYKRNSENKDPSATGQGDYKFIAWDLITGYDMKYLQTQGFIGKLFPRPTKFHITSKYADDSFWLDVFGEDVDILRAYLKEHNVPFGYLKN